MLLAQADDFLAHIDLHETTDTDNSEFRPALAARDGIEHTSWHIPDGFYLVGDAEKPTRKFHAAVIESVETLRRQPLDGESVEQWGVIYYKAREFGLCMGLTNAEYVGTTEVYPDSPKTNPENCIDAQVASVTGALDFLANAKRRSGR